MENVDNAVGALFSRGVAPSEIIDMPYSQLMYWFDWHKKIIEAENKKIEIEKEQIKNA